jgi:hypothetical protein
MASLKLHGYASKPKEIIVTRNEYAQFSESRSALLGIVSAVLVTKLMLLVGFSLADNDFYKLVAEVTSVLAADSSSPTKNSENEVSKTIATAWMLNVGDARREL